MTIREDIEIPIGACHKITSDDLHNKTRTPCPASGPEGQTVVHVRWPSERAKKKNAVNFMSLIITGDGSQVYVYDSETNQTLFQRQTSSSRPKKAWQIKFNVKTIIVFNTDV